MIDRFLRFVCRSRVVVRFLLWVVRSSLISDLGYITVVVVSSVRHMLSSPVRESNGVGTCRVQTQIGWFVSYLYIRACYDISIRGLASSEVRLAVIISHCVLVGVGLWRVLLLLLMVDRLGGQH